ncbi:MAG: TonB-dependent receptor domain-containing protein [Janthinobacterium lividum]
MTSNRRRSLRRILFLTACPCALALGGSSAMAQIAASPLAASPVAGAIAAGQAPGSAETVEVTGSRLRTSNVTSEAPVTVITSKQIEQSSAQTVEDVLRKVPSVGTAGLYGTTNNGGNGASCIDLRNLGIVRTLVLVDGKRFVHSGYGNGADCVDLNTVPVAMIDRIEILKDGASTIYGADAIAGVINIITKKNVVGTTINTGGNITASGDAINGNISGTTGFDFAQGRGNLVLSGSYLDRGKVEQRTRDWANPVISSDSGPGSLLLNSSIPVSGRYFGYDSGTSYGTVVNGKLTKFTSADRYNYGSEQDLLGQLTQGNLSLNGHYDVSPHFQPYVSGYYTHKTSETQLAGQPVTGTVDGSQLFDIPKGNPYAEALGIDEQAYAYKRVSDWGSRQYLTATDARQGTIGAKGNIIGNWDYDAYYTYGRSVTSINQTNQVNFTKLEQEMGFKHTSTTNLDEGVYDPSVCVASTGCVLSNPFGSGAMSAAAIKYASFTSHAQAIYQFRDLGATITNPKLLPLPYGPLGLAIGMEHRGEDGAYHPDPTIASGQSLANTESSTGGGFNVTEVFGELSIPILKNLVMAKDLSADISGRYSSYNTFGSAKNWKAGINWTPVNDIRFRANIGTVTRQPAIEELFGGDTTGYPSATDPCDSGRITSYGSRQATVAANCANKISGYNSSFVQTAAGQVPTISGGNSALRPETARTYTIGTVVTPRWVPNLSMTVDYFHTKIANSISVLSTQYILDQCYESTGLSNAMCSLVNQRTSAGQLSTVSAVYENLGETRTSGIDFDLNYLLRLGGGNTLNFSNELVDTISYLQQETPGGPFLNFKGRIINGLYGTAYPTIRDNFTGTYSKGKFSFGWTVRFIDHMTVNDGSTDLTAATATYYKTNEVFYHDIVATYNWHKIQFIGGIDNLFDKTPLLVVDGSTNTDTNVYDVLGRYFYAKMQFHF